jgi:hypothetical protein
MLPLLRERLHYDWHWQWSHGNGEIANNGSHQLDQVRWALGKPGLPRAVMAFGGRYGYVDDGQTPNTLAAVYDYDGIPVIYEVRGLPADSTSEAMSDVQAKTAGGKPIVIGGSGGTNQGVAIFCEGGYLLRGVVHSNKDGQEIARFDGTPSARPQQNFITAVRSRKTEDLKTDVEQGHLSASFCHMGNMSFLCSESMPFDVAKKAIAGNAHAADALDRMIEHLAANGVDTSTTPVHVGPTLTMDSASERFTGENADRANLFVRDGYREPFVVPEKV